MKEQKEIRYRFLTREECLARYGEVRPLGWNNTGAMDIFLGKEVPQAMACWLIEYGTTNGLSTRYLQPEYRRWCFYCNDIVEVTKSDNFF